jgi:peroxiredoxin
MRFVQPLICSMLVLTATCAAYADGVAIGQAAPQFSLQDQNGKTVNLSDYAGKIVVLEWVNPNCPFVQRHYKAKTMVNLANEFAPKGVVWLAINTTASADNAFNKNFADANNVPYPILNDSAGNVGKAYQAKSTPDMFIIDKSGNLAYSGAIDNDPDGDRGNDRVNYVQKALDEMLAGQSVSVPETKSYGCGVHYAH